MCIRKTSFLTLFIHTLMQDLLDQRDIQMYIFATRSQKLPKFSDFRASRNEKYEKKFKNVFHLFSLSL